MQWLLQGKFREVNSIESFRKHYALPPEFGIATFVPKNTDRLGATEGASTPMQGVRRALVAAIPRETPPGGWMAFLFSFQRTFREQLNSINHFIGLQASEIDYAVTGCCDVLRMYLYEISCAQLANKPVPCFQDVYLRWFSSSVHLSRPLAHYAYGDYLWQIQVISNPFGRAGLAIQTHDATHYIYDTALACPAAGWVTVLLKDIADVMAHATVETEKARCNDGSSSA